MRKFVSSLAVLTVVSGLSIAMPAMAQSIKQKDMIAHDKEKVASLAMEANQACGTRIAFSVDYATYAHDLDDDNNQRPWAYLANATDALKKVCRSDAGKQSVQAKIKSVQVSNGSSETESLTNGVFRYQVPYSGHSPATVVDWLQTNL